MKESINLTIFQEKPWLVFIKGYSSFRFFLCSANDIQIWIYVKKKRKAVLDLTDGFQRNEFKWKYQFSNKTLNINDIILLKMINCYRSWKFVSPLVYNASLKGYDVIVSQWITCLRLLNKSTSKMKWKKLSIFNYNMNIKWI